MIWSLIRLDLRKALPLYLTTMAALVGFILITREILDATNITVAVLAMAQGWILAYQIFRDPHNTQAFVFSRPWSRARIFWNRWALAMILQAITILLVYAILAAGTRTWLYRNELPYFPMVESFELSVLWPIALASFITFHIIMFLIFWCVVMKTGRNWWQSVIIKISLCLILMVLLGSGGIVIVAGSQGAELQTSHLVVIYATVVVLLCTGASLNCTKNMEIES